MSTQLTLKQNATNLALVFDAEKVDLIKKTIAKDATDIELQFFIEQCKRTGLDPISKQIYFIKDKQGKVNIMTSIDGLRLIAQRSEDYQGQTPQQWCGEDGVWKEMWNSKTPPVAARIGVHRKGFKEPLYAVAMFSEYAQKAKDYKTGEEKLNYIWGSKPSVMLSKVAEALALRKAFPNDMSGIYTNDEYVPEVAEEKKLTSVTVIDVQPKKEEVNNEQKTEDKTPSEIKRQTESVKPSVLVSQPRFEDSNNLFTEQERQNDQEFNDYVKHDQSRSLLSNNSEGSYDKSYVIRIGKNRDKTLEEAGYEAVKRSYDYLKKEEDSGKPVEGYAKEFLNKAEPFLASFNNQP